MLSSGGLGYFEYEATVDGDATLRLTVSLDQVDDVLKSLVVYDDKGGVGGLSLPGKEPLRQAFKDLPFDESSLQSPGIPAGHPQGRTNLGRRHSRHQWPHRLGGVGDGRPERRQGHDQAHARHLVHRARPCSSSSSRMPRTCNSPIQALREKVAQALPPSRPTGPRKPARSSSRRAGRASAPSASAYIVEAPVWKASYRLTLPGDPAAAASAPAGLGDDRES
jgi:hypothetical protein